MDTVERVSVFVDKVTKVQNTTARGAAKFDLHVVNIPLTHLTTQIVMMSEKLRDLTAASTFTEHVKESVVFALINNDDRHVHTCRKILCQQSVIVDSTDIVPVSVVVKATELPLEQGHTLEAWRNVEERYLLAPVPANTGCHFSTCTWRNDLYLLGGTLLPTYFAVYKPCDNQWTPLPPFLLGLGRGKHAMAAVNNKIYILGGLIKVPEDNKATSSGVWSYDIMSKTWNHVCYLPKSVQESSTAVLGHRIYLFGGQDDMEVNSDLVQCVDTMNNVAYVAGKLPSGACRPRACSNNGVIWVVLPTGQVLQMWENFHLADQREQHLAVEKNRNREVEPYRDQFTVSFRQLSQISAGDHIAACLNMNSITVIAVDTAVHGCVICDTSIINLTTGEAEKHSTCLTGAQYFDLHYINIPQVHLKQKTGILEVTNFSSRSSDTHSVSSLITTPLPEQNPFLVIKSGSNEQRETTSRPKSPAPGEAIREIFVPSNPPRADRKVYLSLIIEILRWVSA
ncbi:hypothetical protein C0Q70_12512 [Pomacea canaliculata]|uniref:Uncharacterized protein n=1 Tax=Pomacea canaliculata TaxID=400727 RepID=A0A2T7P1R4_POMCA|nr:hypothetical protein C0Q70_12512 [Pomacea canaliculata]